MGARPGLGFIILFFLSFFFFVWLKKKYNLQPTQIICFVNNTHSLSRREKPSGILATHGTMWPSHLLGEVPPWVILQAQCSPWHSQGLWATWLCSGGAMTSTNSVENMVILSPPRGPRRNVLKQCELHSEVAARCSGSRVWSHLSFLSYVYSLQPFNYALKDLNDILINTNLMKIKGGIMWRTME